MSRVSGLEVPWFNGFAAGGGMHVGCRFGVWD